MSIAENFNIYLTGFMASGKSKIGAALADRLGWSFQDTDHLIEEKDGRTVAAIFAEDGEATFRSKEMELIHELAQSEKRIIALGGGTLTNPGVAEILRKSGLLIRLQASTDVLVERISRRDTRPLMLGLSEEEIRAKVEHMLAEREVYYRMADFTVESNDNTSVRQVVDSIMRALDVWTHRKVTVNPGDSPRYPILIGDHYLHKISGFLQSLPGESSYLLVTDSNVLEKQKNILHKIRKQAQNCRFFSFPAGERNKNINALNRLFTFMLKRRYTRKTTLLQFGGGVVGDMAGFGAATYQRGIGFIQIPTTLLSMVDSSVGGKVAVNHPLGKNMIGAFYQPRAVLIDIAVLETLPDEEYLAGLAEVVKYGVIYDEEFFSWLENHTTELLARDEKILAQTVQRCCEIKAEVVSQDEKEQGIRAILNYGHTFGHAIEKLTEYRTFSHGLAVALGMRVAGRLAVLNNMWSTTEEQRQNNLFDALNFPSTFAVDREEAWQAMGVDKKADMDNRVYILPAAMGKVKKVANVDRSLVDQAWDIIDPGRSQ